MLELCFIFNSYHGSVKTWYDKPRFTIDYAPPELVQNTGFGIYSEAIDIWCLGATLFTMFMGHPPFRQGRNEREVSNDVLKQRIINGVFYTESARWKQASCELQMLIQSCMEKDIKKRLTLQQVVQHPWFAITYMKKNTILNRSILPSSAESYENNLRSLDSEIYVSGENLDLYISDNNESVVDMCIGIDDDDLDICYKDKELRQKSTQSEGDATSGLGQSKSSDENSLRAIDLPEVHMELDEDDTYANKDLTVEVNHSNEKLDANSFADTSLEEYLSDQDELIGFDENTPPIQSMLLDKSNKLLTILEQIRQMKEMKISNYNFIGRKKKQKSTVQLHANKRLLRSESNVCRVSNSLTKSKNKLQTKLSTERNIQCAINNLLREETLSLDDDRKKHALKCKSNWRLFCTILRHTQIALKYFNFERRVYNRSIENKAEIKSRKNTTGKIEITSSPQLSKETKEVSVACRKQPSRLARAHRARYVFE